MVKKIKFLESIINPSVYKFASNMDNERSVVAVSSIENIVISAGTLGISQ